MGWNILKQVVEDVLQRKRVEAGLVRQTLAGLGPSVDFPRGLRRVDTMEVETREAILSLGTHPLSGMPIMDRTQFTSLEAHWLKRVSLDGYQVQGGPAAYLASVRAAVTSPKQAYGSVGESGTKLYIESDIGSHRAVAVLDLDKKVVRTCYPTTLGRAAKLARRDRDNEGRLVVEVLPQAKRLP